MSFHLSPPWPRQRCAQAASSRTAPCRRHESATSRHRLYRAHCEASPWDERPMPSPPQCENLPLIRAAETPLGLVRFSFTEHNIPRGAYSFLAKLAGSDFYSPLRISNTRPFPPRRTLFLKLSRNNTSRLTFRIPSSQSVLHRQSLSPMFSFAISAPFAVQSFLFSPVPRRQSSISNHQSSISCPQSLIPNSPLPFPALFSPAMVDGSYQPCYHPSTSFFIFYFKGVIK